MTLGMLLRVAKVLIHHKITHNHENYTLEKNEFLSCLMTKQEIELQQLLIKILGIRLRYLNLHCSKHS